MKCRSPAEPAGPAVLRYGLMRLATHGTGDLTRMTDEQRAAGQQRGHTILQESRDHSAAVYSIFEALRASPGMVIVFEIVISLAAIGRAEPLRRVITLAGVECSNRAAFAVGQFKKFLDDLWHILNQGVGRTAYQVLSDQARNPSFSPAAPSCTRCPVMYPIDRPPLCVRRSLISSSACAAASARRSRRCRSCCARVMCGLRACGRTCYGS